VYLSTTKATDIHYAVKQATCTKEAKNQAAVAQLGKTPFRLQSILPLQDKEEFPLAMRVESMTFSLKKFPGVLSQMVWFSDWARVPIC
jgi:hypothetical protein